MYIIYPVPLLNTNRSSLYSIPHIALTVNKTSLVVQWLGLLAYTPAANGQEGSVPGQETKIFGGSAAKK